MRNTDKVTMTVGQLKRLVKESLKESVVGDEDFRIRNGVLMDYYGDGGDVVIPDGVVEIANEAFEDERFIKSISIPDSVTSIGSGAFSGCIGLTSVTIPDSVTSIGDWAFSGCKGLTSVRIPNDVTSIGKGAFESCTNLRKVSIPKSVKEIGDDAFYHCRNLNRIYVANEGQKKMLLNSGSGLEVSQIRVIGDE